MEDKGQDIQTENTHTHRENKYINNKHRERDNLKNKENEELDKNKVPESIKKIQFQ